MGSFTCCIWWLVFGVLLGWLLSWWLSKLIGHKEAEEIQEPIEPPQPSLKERFFDNPVPRDSESFVPSSVQAEPDSELEPELIHPQGQAGFSAIPREEMIKAAAAAGISFSGVRSDLEIIEGIGPKIAELLEANGINTFAELSRTSVVSLEKVLESGGDRFRMANPSTWALQAELAAEHKWAELKILQDSLDGGVAKI